MNLKERSQRLEEREAAESACKGTASIYSLLYCSGIRYLSVSILHYDAHNCHVGRTFRTTPCHTGM